jgi:hypothetical protein
MAFYILTKTGKIIVRKSVWGLSEDDFANPDIKIRLVYLDEGIHSKIGDDLTEEDIDPELRGSMPEVSDDVFDDEVGNHMTQGTLQVLRKGQMITSLSHMMSS